MNMTAAVMAPVSAQVVDLMPHRLAHALRERVRYRYVQPRVVREGTSFRIQSPCCSRNVATNGGKEWEIKMQALFDSSPYGKGCKSYPKRDLWHLRSLLCTEPVDFMIGNTYGKFLERDTKTPLVRLVFPIFDRHHYHRYATWGYDGAMRVLVMLLDEFIEALDGNTMEIAKTDYSYDIVR